MPLDVDCPRCKHPLAVPESQAGSYVRCPRCRGRLWVPSEEEQREAIRECAQLGQTTGATAGDGATSAAEPAISAKVARFLIAAPTDSYLKLAEDGKLPELRLPDPRSASAKEAGRAGMNPLVMAVLCCLSAAASLVLVLMPDVSGGSARSQEKQRARAAIESDYFSDVDGLPRQPYQFQLREAQRAFLRGDYRQEREAYRRMLEMLRAERKPDTGVTGSPRRDQELERLLIVLLGK